MNPNDPVTLSRHGEPLSDEELNILSDMLQRFERRRAAKLALQPAQIEAKDIASVQATKIGPDRKILLDVRDGPERITIYTSEEEAVVDCANDIPALYVEVALQDCYAKLGPFQLKSIREGVEKALGTL